MQRITGHVQSFGFFMVCCVILVCVVGCGEVTTSEAPVNVQTILALTPTKTPTFTPSPTLTPTPSPTLPPTNTPTPPPPTPTSPPPTPTPNPALKGFTFCNQDIGDVTSGRFSASSSGVMTIETFPAFERLTFPIQLAQESAPFSGYTSLINERDYILLTGEPAAPAPYVLMISFPGWLQDTLFHSSPMSATHTFTDTNVIRQVKLRPKPASHAGFTMMVGLAEPVISHVSLSRDQSQLRIEVARPSSQYVGNDDLATPSNGGVAKLSAPIFFLLQGDIWRISSTNLITLTHSPEHETSLAVSRDGTHVAFCRTQDPGVQPLKNGIPVPSSLWIMNDDATDVHRIPDTGINCDDLAFSPDGSMLAFSSDETGTNPPERSIRIIAVDPTLLFTETVNISHALSLDHNQSLIVEQSDGWNRFAPQWINNTSLIYAANAPDNRSTLFILDLPTGVEHNIGTNIQVIDQQFRYRSLGRPLVSPDGRAIALEAERADEPGADMVLLDANGIQQDVLSEGYWTRPLAWSDQGGLYYLQTVCQSTVVDHYELRLRDSQGKNRILTTGTTFGAIGDALAVGNGLAYVIASRAEAGTRGPNMASPYSPSTLWLWDIVKETRGELFSAQGQIKGIVK